MYAVAELGVMYPQVGFAFRSVENALTLIVRNLESFSGLAAETERLDALAAGALCCCFDGLIWSTPVAMYSIALRSSHAGNVPALAGIRKCWQACFDVICKCMHGHG